MLSMGEAGVLGVEVAEVVVEAGMEERGARRSGETSRGRLQTRRSEHYEPSTDGGTILPYPPSQHNLLYIQRASSPNFVGPNVLHDSPLFYGVLHTYKPSLSSLFLPTIPNSLAL